MIKRTNHIELENEKHQILQIYKPDGISDSKFPFVLDMCGSDLIEVNIEDIRQIIEMLEEFEASHA